MLGYAATSWDGPTQSETLQVRKAARSHQPSADNIGAPDANYDIRSTALPLPSSSIELEPSVGTSGVISVRFTVRPGARQKPIYFDLSPSYYDHIDEITDLHCVFYDTVDRRAWLVDGPSTVLHLLRASVKSHAGDRCLAMLCPSIMDDLEEAPPAMAYTGCEASMDVLLKPGNQDLMLGQIRRTSDKRNGIRLGGDSAAAAMSGHTLTFKRRVEQLSEILLKLSKTYGEILSDNDRTWRVPTSPHQQIEGFE